MRKSKEMVPVCGWLLRTQEKKDLMWRTGCLASFLCVVGTEHRPVFCCVVSSFPCAAYWGDCPFPGVCARLLPCELTESVGLFWALYTAPLARAPVSMPVPPFPWRPSLPNVDASSLFSLLRFASAFWVLRDSTHILTLFCFYEKCHWNFGRDHIECVC